MKCYNLTPWNVNKETLRLQAWQIHPLIATQEGHAISTQSFINEVLDTNLSPVIKTFIPFNTYVLLWVQASILEHQMPDKNIKQKG